MTSRIVLSTALLVLSLLACSPAGGQGDAPEAAKAQARTEVPQGDAPPQILFTNANVFDGFRPDLIEGANVLVEGNVITQVSTDPIDAPDAFVVDATGKTMTPGLIDMHSHIVFMTPEGTNSYSDEWDGPGGGAMAAQAVRDDYLMKGVTTIRDIAGNSRGIARAAQRGLLISPRIYTAGSVLSHTGGHGDWGARDDMHVVDHGAEIQHSMIVDGREDVVRATRRNYRNGAHFTKIMAGGGVASRFDPLEILGATKEEMEAAVEMAENYGTYVAIHAYHDRSYQQALDAGVRSFEHGFLVSEDIVKQMAAKGEEVAWSFQCFMSINSFGSYETMPEFFTHEQKLKGVAVGKGARNAAKMMKEQGVFIVGGSDMFGPGLQERIKEDLTCNVTGAGFTPAEALKHWTGNAGKVLKWSGPLDPYPTYALGTIAPNSYADILLWDGNPLEDIELILDESRLQLVMKDGRAFKNTMVDTDSIMYRPGPAKAAITQFQ
jgi:imidazolonepropionase-like amidohydrolase